MPRTRLIKSPLFMSFATAAALTLVAAPITASYADAAGRKKSNGMMRLGGPSKTGSSKMMRLGGPTESRGVDRGIYSIPDRFVSNRPADVREYFLRRDQQGNGS